MPGWCGSRKVFDELAARCAEQRRTLVLDWRQVSKLEARSHFPMYEVPGEMAMVIERFVAA